MATDCPITAEAGTVPENDNTPDLKNLNSYMMVHHNLHIRQQLYCDRFSEHVLAYAIEWENVIVSRVSSSLTHAAGLRRELDHYQSKFDRIMADKSRIIAKGLSVDEKLAEKLSRNQAKLTTSKESYEIYAADLSTLIHEVTARGWKDLHPILLKLAQFDATLASDEHQLLSNLTSVSNNLKKIAQRYGLKPESRLKDIESLSAKLLLNDGENRMMITDGNSPSPSPSTEKVRTMPSNTSGFSKQSSKENDDAVIRDVVSNIINKGEGSRMSRTGSGSSRQYKSHGSSNGGVAKEFDGRSKQMNHNGDFNDDRRHERNASRSKGRSSNEARTAEMTERRPSRPRSRMKSRGPGDDDKSTANPFDGMNEGGPYAGTRLQSNSKIGRNKLTPFDDAVAKDQTRNGSRNLLPSSPRYGAYVSESPQNTKLSSRSKSNSYSIDSPASGQYSSQWSRELTESPPKPKGCNWYELF